MGFARYVIALAAGFAADFATLHVVHVLLGITPFPARCISLATALVVACITNEIATRGSFDRRRLRPTLVIAAMVNLVLYAMTIMRFPDIQPLAALVLSSVAGLMFALIGYWRFFRRIG